VRLANLNDTILQIFLTKLRHQLGNHIKQVILFGSRARGEQSVLSDYDCMVLLDVIPSDINNIIDEITGELLYEYNVIFSVFPVAESRYLKQIHNPLFINVKNEGIAL
jgi:predicted nucleotidyltransferase